MAKITKSLVDRSIPGEREYFVWDDDVKGFGLRVAPSGRKTYILQYRAGGGRQGKLRRPRIGRHGALTPNEARQIAKAWAADIAKGRDPSAERAADRNAQLMNDLFDRYLSDHARIHKKPSSLAEDERLIRMYLRDAFGKQKIAEVTRDDVQKFHNNLQQKPYRANRALAVLSKAFNLAEIWSLRPDGSNPCRHVRKYREKRRERFLDADELRRLGAALDAASRGALVVPVEGPVFVSQDAVAAIRLLLFTGARRGEILGLKWSYVDFSRRRLALPDSKTGAKFIQLPLPAIEVLRTLPRRGPDDYVIKGGKPGSALVNLKKPWTRIRRAAQLEDVRLHDLRHSFASVAAGSGHSLPIIGALLGHKNAGTTERYAHLASDPLVAASDDIAGRLAQFLMQGEAA